MQRGVLSHWCGVVQNNRVLLILLILWYSRQWCASFNLLGMTAFWTKTTNIISIYLCRERSKINCMTTAQVNWVHSISISNQYINEMASPIKRPLTHVVVVVVIAVDIPSLIKYLNSKLRYNIIIHSHNRSNDDVIEFAADLTMGAFRNERRRKKKT